MSLNICIILAIVILVCCVFIYNNGVKLRNYVREAFSTMDIYMKKRWDLVPNLIETVKGYTEHEQSIFKEITELRSKTYSNLNDNEKMEINKELGIGLSKLIAVAENYPDLKANQQFNLLMEELTHIEDDIASARKYYNGTVRELNNYTEMFPTSIFAALFGFHSMRMYEADEEERENVKVNF